MKSYSQRLLGGFVLVLAGATLLVGAAYAEPEYQAGVRLRADAGAPAVAPVPEVSERPGQGGTSVADVALRVPVPEVSERPGQGGVGVVALAPVPEVSERPGQGGVASIETPIISVADVGFSWSDALVGAGSALGLVLLLGGAAALTMRHRGGMITH